MIAQGESEVIECFIKANKIFMDLQRAINPWLYLLSGTCVSSLIDHNCGLDVTGNLSKYSESHDLKDLILDVVAGVIWYLNRC